MDFQLSEEDIQIRNLAKTFAERIKPELRRREKINDPKERYPWPILEEAHKLGFRTLKVPKEYGGLGANTFTTTLVIEEFAAADAGFAQIFNKFFRDPDQMRVNGTEEQKRSFFEKLVKDS